MSLFKRRIVMCIGRQGRLVMIALLWLSASENKVFILCQSDVSALISPMRPSPSPLTTTTTPTLLTSCLDLELLFKGMVYWCSLLPLLPMRRGAAAFHVDANHDWKKSYKHTKDAFFFTMFSCCFYYQQISPSGIFIGNYFLPNVKKKKIFYGN